jgi:hypothetical protein
MNIRALMITAFVAVLILTGCASAPGRIANLVAQGIPSDLEINYSYWEGYKLGGEAVHITADGSATYSQSPSDYGGVRKEFVGKLPPEALRRVVLAFEDKRFFSSRVRDCKGQLTDIGSRTVSIRVGGSFKEVTRDNSPECEANSDKGTADFMSLIGILRGAVANLPPVTPSAAATGKPVSTATPAGP